AGSKGRLASSKPLPLTKMPLTVPVPAPWLRMVMVAVVVVLMSTAGKLIVAPLGSGKTLWLASVYEAVKLGEAEVPVRLPVIDVPVRLMAKVPLKLPACGGEKVIPNVRLWPAETVVGNGGAPVN